MFPYTNKTKSKPRLSKRVNSQLLNTNKSYEEIRKEEFKEGQLKKLAKRSISSINIIKSTNTSAPSNASSSTTLSTKKTKQDVNNNDDSDDDVSITIELSEDEEEISEEQKKYMKKVVDYEEPTTESEDEMCFQSDTNNTTQNPNKYLIRPQAYIEMQLASRAKPIENEWFVKLKTADRFLFHMWQRKTYYKHAYNNLLKSYKLSFDGLKDKGIIDDKGNLLVATNNVQQINNENDQMYRLIEDLNNRTKRLEEENMALINNDTVLKETIENVESEQKKLKRFTDAIEYAIAEEEAEEEEAEEEEEEEEYKEKDGSEEDDEEEEALVTINTSEEEEEEYSKEDLEPSQSTLGVLTQSDSENEEVKITNSFSPITQPTTPSTNIMEQEEEEENNEETRVEDSDQENETAVVNNLNLNLNPPIVNPNPNSTRSS
ncbi:hypothetical protein ABK040_011648 [Willaertia magna]